MAAETRLPRMHSLRSVRAAQELRSTGRMEMLDLHVFSNCSLDRAELMVGRCVESDTQDFVNTRPLLNHGLVSTLALTKTESVTQTTSIANSY